MAAPRARSYPGDRRAAQRTPRRAPAAGGRSIAHAPAPPLATGALMKQHVRLLTLLCAATAGASVWDRALNNSADDAARDLEGAKMTEGDGAARLAGVESTSLKSR